MGASGNSRKVMGLQWVQGEWYCINKFGGQNDGWRKLLDPLPTFERKSRLVTQIIGIIHKDGMIVSSDSQFTLGSSTLMNAEKISILRCNNGDVVVAQAGAFDKSSVAIGNLNAVRIKMVWEQ